jgi:hypothetical protein
VMARRLTAETTVVAEQVERAVQLAWLRTPTPDEQKRFSDFVSIHGLPALCRVLFNSNEFLFIP